MQDKIKEYLKDIYENKLETKYAFDRIHRL